MGSGFKMCASESRSKSDEGTALRIACQKPLHVKRTLGLYVGALQSGLAAVEHRHLSVACAKPQPAPPGATNATASLSQEPAGILCVGYHERAVWGTKD